MEHARLHLTIKERMHPDGLSLYDSAAEALHAALAQPETEPPRDEWRPASEPPDSERLVIAWCQGRAHVALHMPDTDPHWYQCPSPNNEDWYDLNDVTHWRDVTPPMEGAK